MNSQQIPNFQIEEDCIQLQQKNATMPIQTQERNTEVANQSQLLKVPLFLKNITERAGINKINSCEFYDGFSSNKRQKWTKLQDTQLREIVEKQNAEEIDWEKVSDKMQIRGHTKTSKQCRERWLNQLDPKLSKEKWTLQENMELFFLHEQQGSRWKDIADHFEGRTDNSIKNQFFSLIRKSLRSARKLLDQGSNTALINRMKPKVLSEFMCKTIKIKIPGTFTESKQLEEENLVLREFVKKFAFGDHHKFQQEVTDRDIFIIREVIEFLISINNKYISVKNKKIDKKKKKQLQRQRLKQRQKKQNIVEVAQKQERPEIQIEQNRQKLDLSQALQELAQKKQEIETKNDKYLKNPQYAFLDGEKDKIVKNLMEIGEIAYSMGQLINNSTRQEYDDFFKNQKNFFNQFLFSRKCSDESLLQKINIQELLNNSEQEQNQIQNRRYEQIFNQGFQIQNNPYQNNSVNLNNSANANRNINPLNESYKIKQFQRNLSNQSFNMLNSQNLLQGPSLTPLQEKNNFLFYNPQVKIPINSKNINNGNISGLNQSFKQENLFNSKIQLPLIENNLDYVGKTLQINQEQKNELYNSNQKDFEFSHQKLDNNNTQIENQYLKELIESSNMKRNNGEMQFNNFLPDSSKVQKPNSIRVQRNQNHSNNSSESFSGISEKIDVLKMNERANKNKDSDIFLSNNSSIN